ncbi:MAG TPA: hypothetical protein VGH24_04115 [Solirubrobacteraceae bacterium]
MHLAFDICQGIGLATAVGIRPFLPALAAGALAAGDVELSFKHTDYAFLQGWPFLLAMAIGAILLAVLERRLGTGADAKPGEGLERGPLAVAVIIASVAIGALLFAGALAQHHGVVWPGFAAGAVCALIAAAASRPLFARARARLDAAAAAALPLYAEAAGVLLAVLSVLLPPVGPIGLAFLIWLLIAGRGRGEQKYAGLRILR